MNQDTPTPEDMGLRLEPTRQLRLIDLVLLLALILSSVAWMWLSVAGVETELLAALASPAGRIVAALVGLACVAAVVRVFRLSRWPVSENDRSLV